MKSIRKAAGFSLMEVNMAIFVMAVGILSLATLFPLGLREGIQGKEDLQQSMFADFALNQIVAALSDTNLNWSEWCDLDKKVVGAGAVGSIPAKVDNMLKLDLNGAWTVSGENMTRNHYRIMFRRPEQSKMQFPTASDRIMGIGVQSTDVDFGTGSQSWQSWSNNVIYYAEAMFSGNKIN